MRSRTLLVVAAVTLLCRFSPAASSHAQAADSPAGAQPGVVRMIISSGAPGVPPRIAVPPFLPLTGDAETTEGAKVIADVLWDDLEFEREFYLIPRDTYPTIPQAASLDQVPIDRWKELGADGVAVGSVEKTPSGVTVRFRLINVATGTAAMAKEYTGASRTMAGDEIRQYAHAIADDVHEEQRGLRGVARTRIAFSSDRDGARMRTLVKERGVSNLYIADYDGARQQRVTISPWLDISPAWAPDGRTLAFSSWRSGYQDIYLLFPFSGAPLQNPTKGTADSQNYLPAWSPDGAKLAFTSSRDGNQEIYAMNRDGSGVQRLTTHPATDVTPTWSPTGAQIAFVSDRTGRPQIYVMNADGSGLRRITYESHCDRPTWSPGPLNEIAYSSTVGAGNVIKIFDVATQSSRALTDPIGNNESPSFSPNGRHVAFSSTRAGREQIFTIHRDGSGLRQITRAGANRFPNWSR